jgi:hypothetical protein
MKTIKFIGQITTVAPVTVALPNVTGIPRNTHGAYYIPATSIRGFLRSTAATAISQLLQKQGKTLTVDEIYMNFSGVDTGRKIKLGGGYERIGKNLEIREKNPQVSNFGNFGVAGKLKVGNAYCDPNSNPITTYGNGSRNHPFNRNPSVIGFVDPNELGYLKSVMDADSQTALETADLKTLKKQLQSKAKQLTGEDKKAVFKEIEDIDQKIKETKETRVGTTESILRPLDGFSAIDAGHTLEHRMILNNPSDQDFNFLLWVLWKGSVNFNLGGHQSLGCGEVHAHWDIVESTFDDPTPRKIGTLKINDDGFQLDKIDFDPKQIDNAISNEQFDFTVF